MKKIIVFIIFLTFISCGISRQTVKNEQNKVNGLKHKLIVAKKTSKLLNDYINRLKHGLPLGQIDLYFNRTTIEKSMNLFMPYKVNAHELHKQLKGQFVISKITNVKFLSRNRIGMRMHFYGKKVNFNIKGYAKIKREVKLGLEAGGYADVIVYLSWDKKQGGVRAYARALKVALRKYNKSSYTHQILRQLNAKFLRYSKLLPFPYIFKHKNAYVFTTNNHVIVGF